MARQYNDLYGYLNKSKKREAENNDEFVALREVYLDTSLLYETIIDQYPTNYQVVYKRLVELKKAYAVNNIHLIQGLYLEDSSDMKYIEISEELDDEIERMEKYMDKQILNPSNVKFNDVSHVKHDYTYASTLGILFYNNGEIEYIGEHKKKDAWLWKSILHNRRRKWNYSKVPF